MALYIIAGLIAISAYGFVDERITLNKKGEAYLKAEIDPKETKVFVIAGKDFGVLKGAMATNGSKISWEIKAPSGKTILRGSKRAFKFKRVGDGDHKIIIRNVGRSRVSFYIGIGDIKG